MSAVEFLNLLAYTHDRNDERKRQMEEWKRTH